MERSRRGRPRGRGDGNPAAPNAKRKWPELADPIQRKGHRPLPDFTGMAPTTTTTDAGFRDFLPVSRQIVDTPPSWGRRAVGYAVCGTIVAVILWSSFGYLRLFAIATGEVDARGGNQVIEPLEAGQVSAIPVQNGSHVAAGATVLQIDPTAARAAELIVEAKLADSRAEAFRHSSAAFLVRQGVTEQKQPLAWPKNIPADVRAREETVMQADLAQLAAVLADLTAKMKTEQATIAKLEANISAQKVLIESRTKRTAMHETLYGQGWDSRAIVLQSLEPLREDQVHLADYEGTLAQAQAVVPVLKAQMKAASEAFIADNVIAAAAAERMSVIEQQELIQARKTLDDLTLRAPVDGVVQGLAVTNIGQSVKVGEMLMQIVPDKAPLEVTAYVLNSDIGFVEPGQPVTLKIDTFPYTRYGTISGHVVSVGADAITGQFAQTQQTNDATTPTNGALSATNATQQMKDLVFPVTVAMDKTWIAVNGRRVPLTSGMSVVAEIETARRRAITYILYPLTRIFQRGTPPSGS